MGPATDAEIRRAGAGGKGVIVAPIAFVSEHSETLVELDIEYGKLAREAGVPDYRRVATVGADAGLHRRLGGTGAKSGAGSKRAASASTMGRRGICPRKFVLRCGSWGAAIEWTEFASAIERCAELLFPGFWPSTSSR